MSGNPGPVYYAGRHNLQVSALVGKPDIVPLLLLLIGANPLDLQRKNQLAPWKVIRTTSRRVELWEDDPYTCCELRILRFRSEARRDHGNGTPSTGSRLAIETASQCHNPGGSS